MRKRGGPRQKRKINFRLLKIFSSNFFFHSFSPKIGQTSIFHILFRICKDEDFLMRKISINLSFFFVFFHIFLQKIYIFKYLFSFFFYQLMVFYKFSKFFILHSRPRKIEKNILKLIFNVVEIINN